MSRALALARAGIGLTGDTSGNVTLAGKLTSDSALGQLAFLNSSNANGGYLSWATSGTVIADIGTAQQCYGNGGNDTFGINARGVRALTFGTNNSERARIDSAGNFGLGVTPVAWASGKKAIEVGNLANGIASFGVNDTRIVSNLYYDGAYRYGSNGFGAMYLCGSSTGSHAWYTAANNVGGAGAAATLTAVASIDQGGNMSVKGSTISTYFDGLTIGSGTNAMGCNIYMGSGTGGVNFMSGTAGGNRYDGYVQYTAGSTQAMTFGTAGTERARINSTGQFLIGATGDSSGSNGHASLVVGQMGIATYQAGYNTTIDTGIPINQGSYGGTALLMVSGHVSNGLATHSSLYLIQFYYDGNNTPSATLIAGSNIVTVGKSGSNTLTLYAQTIPTYTIIMCT